MAVSAYPYLLSLLRMKGDKRTWLRSLSSRWKSRSWSSDSSSKQCPPSRSAGELLLETEIYYEGTSIFIRRVHGGGSWSAAPSRRAARIRKKERIPRVTIQQTTLPSHWYSIMKPLFHSYNNRVYNYYQWNHFREPFMSESDTSYCSCSFGFSSFWD